MTNKDNDYDLLVVKSSKIDKDGNDISSDKFGSGGRRKKDGTLSSLYSDPQPLENFLPPYSSQANNSKHVEDKIDKGLDVVLNITTFINNNPQIIYKCVDIGHNIKVLFNAALNKITKRNQTYKSDKIISIKDLKEETTATKNQKGAP